MVTCSHCGTEAGDNAQFCPKCYERIERPGFWKRLFSLFKTSKVSVRPIIKITRTVDISNTDKDGSARHYLSLDELPPDLRAEIEKVQTEAEREGAQSVERMEPDKAGNSTFSFVIKKNVSVYRVKDREGNEKVYHSPDELPPEIREAFEKIKKWKGDGK